MKNLIAGMLLVLTLVSTSFAQQQDNEYPPGNYSASLVTEHPITDVVFLMMNSNTCSYCLDFLKRAMPEWGNFQKFSLKEQNTVIPDLYIVDLPPERKFPRWILTALSQHRMPKVMATPTFFLWDGNRVVEELRGFPPDIYPLLLKMKIKYDETIKEQQQMPEGSQTESFEGMPF